jgi:predicted RNase H-like HicB family nuclease
MIRYFVIIEKGSKKYSAFSPDVSGCIAVGHNVKETIRLIKLALGFHLAWRRKSGIPLPQPSGISRHIDDGLFEKARTGREFYSIEVEVAIY